MPFPDKVTKTLKVKLKLNKAKSVSQCLERGEETEAIIPAQYLIIIPSNMFWPLLLKLFLEHFKIYKLYSWLVTKLPLKKSLCNDKMLKEIYSRLRKAILPYPV